MSLPVFLVAFLGLIGAANARLNAVVLGHPVSIPWLGIAAAVILLILAALVLWLVRSIVRDGLRLRYMASLRTVPAGA